MNQRNDRPRIPNRSRLTSLRNVRHSASSHRPSPPGDDAGVTPGTLHFSQLPAPHQHLVRAMQVANHARIPELHVRDGKPVFDPPPVIKRTHVSGRHNGPPIRCFNPDFVLKREVLELLALFDNRRSVLIHDLVIADGLPIRWDVVSAVDSIMN